MGKTVHKQDPAVVENMPESRYAPDQLKNKIRLYSWGNAAFGSLGVPSFVKPRHSGQSKIPSTNRPKRVAFGNLHNVKDVACGNGFTVISATHKDHNFRVFGTGINTDSQIGFHMVRRGHPLVIIATPVPIQIPLQFDDTKILRVACGRTHTVILTDKEGIFSLGNNAFGQCGRPIVEGEIYENSNKINQIEGIEEKVIDVVCGQDHTLFLTDDGSVYSCGWGADGQTGSFITGQGHYSSKGIPMKVKGDIEGEKIVQVSGIVDCVLAVSEKGDLFGWGNSEYGQLDACTKEQQLNIAKNLPFKKIGKIKRAASGGTMCAVVNDKGLVYVWGYGILGQGPNVTHQSEPSLLPPPLFGRNELNPKELVTDVACGLSCFAAITNSGSLYMWGKNRDGCLGLGSDHDQYFPYRIAVPGEVKKVSCGVDHTFALCHSCV